MSFLSKLFPKKQKFLFISQFDFDLKEIELKRKASKDKQLKEYYEALLHVKRILSYCICGDYVKYPSFHHQFKDAKIQQQFEEYIDFIKPLALELNKRVGFLEDYYYENYLEMNIDTNDKNVYEIKNQLIKDDYTVKKLVFQIKSKQLSLPK